MTKSNKITLIPSDDDRAWLTEQAESLGLDDPSLALRALVRYARISGMTLAVSAGGTAARAVPAQSRRPRVSAMSDAELIPEGMPELADNPDAPVDEDAVEALVAAGLAQAEGDGRLDTPVRAAAEHFPPLSSSVVPLRLNDRRGYLLGSTAVAGR